MTPPPLYRQFCNGPKGGGKAGEHCTHDIRQVVSPSATLVFIEGVFYAYHDISLRHRWQIESQSNMQYNSNTWVFKINQCNFPLTSNLDSYLTACVSYLYRKVHPLEPLATIPFFIQVKRAACRTAVLQAIGKVAPDRISTSKYVDVWLATTLTITSLHSYLLVYSNLILLLGYVAFKA